MTITKVFKAPKGSASLYLVKDDRGTPIGFLEKFRNTRTETHPWKAFRFEGYEDRNHYLGAFYEDGSVPQDGQTLFGGKKAALQAIFSS